tara:strand:- start:1644 stop:1961 length:318 start_codon:yes stop_codon:yes gene_type:complete
VVIRVDIDETICNSPEDRNYANATPLNDRIDHINKLYDTGNTIIYWTARGTTTDIDWREVTEKQFRGWGVKYHELHFGKPAYDLFIDDKNINSDVFFERKLDEYK